FQPGAVAGGLLDHEPYFRELKLRNNSATLPEETVVALHGPRAGAGGGRPHPFIEGGARVHAAATARGSRAPTPWRMISRVFSISVRERGGSVVSSPRTSGSGRLLVLPSLPGLRWTAALLVFLYHVSVVQYYGGVPASYVNWAFGAGDVGVSFFFVL